MSRIRQAATTPFDRGQTAAEGQHHGAALEEPSIKAMFDEVAASLSIQYRTHARLMSAQTAFANAAEATNQAAADEVSAQDCTSSIQRAAASRRRIAETRQRKAESDLRQIERQTVDELYVTATEGLAPIRDFVTGFNSARQLHANWGTPLEAMPTDHELATELIRLAVRQPDLSEPTPLSTPPTQTHS